jgi:simple sugar transport system ATP-binding protein
MAVLDLVGITKRFGSLLANDRISLSLDEGEVLALLGENGAGKTTLMNILFGHYVADEGEIRVRGKALPPGSPEAAIEAGIGMVHQHFTLADNLTVLENVILGREKLWSLRQNKARGRARIGELAADFGIEIDPDALVGELSVGERQRVEILKALYGDVQVLILDEPTAVLTPQETDSLFDTLRRMVAQGRSAVIISHKLHEILRVSDRIAVLRRGAVVGCVATAEADRDSLAEMMVGRRVVRPKAEPMTPGDEVLSFKGVGLKDAKAGVLLDSIDFSLRAHEILGIAGVSGNGQSHLAAIVSGLTRPSSGQVKIFDEAVQKTLCPQNVVASGVGRIPEDRHAQGVVGAMTVWENLASENLRQPPVSRYGFLLDKGAARQQAAELIAAYDVRCKGPDAETHLLSGGNMQKLILARALSRAPKLILANQPVRGLDEGAIAYVHEQLLAARRGGAGILLITEDLDELLALADRVAVIYRGRLSPIYEVKDVAVPALGLMMAGHDAAEHQEGSRRAV